jgi:hypothetical protein
MDPRSDPGSCPVSRKLRPGHESEYAEESEMEAKMPNGEAIRALRTTLGLTHAQAGNGSAR